MEMVQALKEAKIKKEAEQAAQMAGVAPAPTEATNLSDDIAAKDAPAEDAPAAEAEGTAEAEGEDSE